jgi:hypothetical protein
MPVLDVLRDAAAEFVTAESRNDVAAVVRRAVSRLSSGRDGSSSFADLFPAVSPPPDAAVHRGVLVLDPETAGRQDLATAPRRPLVPGLARA